MVFKVLYVVPPTGLFAGIERVIDEVCAELAVKQQGVFEVDVLHMSSYDNNQIVGRAYNVIQEDCQGRLDLLRIIRRVAVTKPYDIIVVPQVEATVISWVACLGARRKFVLYLHGNPKFESGSWKAKILFLVMRLVVLPRLAYVFGTSPRQLISFQAMLPSTVPHIWVPNPVRRFGSEHARGDEVSIEEDKIVTFANVGRFSYQKGQDVLIKAFAELIKERPRARLRIVGYGPDEKILKAQIADSGLQSSVSLEYFPESPQSVLVESDVYVSTSRWEGWSLAICEALRFGLPVIATDCDFGPSDILIDRRLGQLIPLGTERVLVRSLVDAMLYYYDNLAEEKEQSGFRKIFVDRYDVKSVVDIHAQALMQAMA